MNFIDLITPMILTYNEESNIERTLAGLDWAKQILVVDSYSTDRTIEILKKNPRVRILQRKFDNFADQCNFGLTNITTEWVLSLDSDYLVTSRWVNEASQISKDINLSAYIIPLKIYIYGKPIKSSIVPPRIALYKKSSAHYEMDGHGHKVKITGKISRFSHPIFVDDQKKLSVWFKNQATYAEDEAEKLLKINFIKLSFSDKIRSLYIFAPFLVFLYCIIFKLGFLDGWRGWYYAFQRAFFELSLSISLIDKKISSI